MQVIATQDMTLGAIVAKNRNAAYVFSAYQLDFCCAGKRSLSAACADLGVPLEEVLSRLQKVVPEQLVSSQREFDWSLDFLVDYIEQVHHRYVRKMIPVLQRATQKIAAVHKEQFPEFEGIAHQFDLLATDLLEHMEKEERVLFPYIRELVQTGTRSLPSVHAPIYVMEHEHEYVGELIKKIRTLCKGFASQDGHCEQVAFAFDTLSEFEQDLIWHIHLENNILFPRLLNLDKTSPGQARTN